MVKIINVTLSDETHDVLQKIKDKKGFSNNSEALQWIIQQAARAAGVED